MAKVELENINKSFGPTAALNDVTIRIDDGEFLVIVGPSGCGKSTLLRLVAGLDVPDSGRILFDGIDLTSRPSIERGVAMVFQSYALYPHWTVFNNIAFPLKIRHTAKSTIDKRVREIAESLQLTNQLEKRPKELSGGQRQRVALGRAIAADPRVFLFDEPLSNLDAPLRAEMRQEIVTRQKNLAKTSLYVTHDQTEALTMADRIILLDAGRVMGIGTPQDLYDNPPNRFVAQFLGRPQINLMNGIFAEEANAVTVGPHHWRIPESMVRPRVHLSSTVEIGVRPEHLRPVRNSIGANWRVAAREFLGDKICYSLEQGESRLTMLANAHDPIARDTVIGVEPIAERLLFFDPVSGNRFASND